jgi:iron complex transport system permease protein
MFFPSPHNRLPWLSLFLLVCASVLALSLGRYAISPAELGQFFATALGLGQLPPDRYQLLHSVIIDARLPRVLAAVLVGAGLSVSGAAYQAVFRNPLVSPGLLGVLSGCAFGAALGIIWHLPALSIALLACVTGLIAVAVGVGIAQMFQSPSILLLVLGGIVANALFTSLLSITQYVADPVDQLPSIVYWLLGSLSAVDQHALLWIGPVLALAIVVLCLGGRAIDALSLSDDEAYSLGVPVQKIRFGVIVLATLICALTVSLAGMVGWIGLLVPHLARLLVGPGNGRLLPVSACLGGVFLLIADAVARSVSAGEIPLGIITELFGAVAFVLVLHRVRKGWL